jgi:RNA polymerase sigma factor (sigma-70 family)
MSRPERLSVLRHARRVLGGRPGDGVGDVELLRRFAARRDEAAFELLLWRHGPMVWRVCRSVLRDAHAAEDAFQATFLVLARKAATAGRRGSVAGWLYRVAYHAALKARARSARAATHEQADRPDPAPAGPAEAAALRELTPVLHDEVNRLPAKYRTPLVLCCLEGLTHAEAARQLGWPKGTVAGRLARARDWLHERLTRRGVVFPAAGLSGALAPDQLLAVPAPVREAAGRIATAASSAGPDGLSPSVVQLSEGVLRTMFLTKLKLAAAVTLAVGLIGAGLAPLAGRAQDPRPRSRPAPVAVKPAVADEGPKAPGPETAAGRKLRSDSINNLKQIMLAFHNHNDVYNTIPADIVGKDGKALLSWRVAILPFMEQEALYKQFRLDEPWDSPANIRLLARMPKLYQAGADPDGATTYYQGFAGKGTAFEPGKKLRLVADFPDGTSNTAVVFEAGEAVAWTKPADMPYDPKKPLPKLGGVFPEAIHAAMGDGSVITIRRDFDEPTMRLLIDRQDGMPFDMDKLHARLPKGPGPGRGGRGRMEDLQREIEELRAALEDRQVLLQQIQAESERGKADELLREARARTLIERERAIEAERAAREKRGKGPSGEEIEKALRELRERGGVDARRAIEQAEVERQRALAEAERAAALERAVRAAEAEARQQAEAQRAQAEAALKQAEAARRVAEAERDQAAVRDREARELKDALSKSQAEIQSLRNEIARLKEQLRKSKE